MSARRGSRSGSKPAIGIREVRIFPAYLSYTISGASFMINKQAICNKNLRDAYQSWVQWLEDESVSSSAKCAELQAQDDQGWCPLHYAARYYCSDLLAAALDVEEGQLTACVAMVCYGLWHNMSVLGPMQKKFLTPFCTNVFPYTVLVCYT